MKQHADEHVAMAEVSRRCDELGLAYLRFSPDGQRTAVEAPDMLMTRWLRSPSATRLINGALESWFTSDEPRPIERLEKGAQALSRGSQILVTL